MSVEAPQIFTHLRYESASDPFLSPSCEHSEWYFACYFAKVYRGLIPLDQHSSTIITRSYKRIPCVTITKDVGSGLTTSLVIKSEEGLLDGVICDLGRPLRPIYSHIPPTSEKGKAHVISVLEEAGLEYKEPYLELLLDIFSKLGIVIGGKFIENINVSEPFLTKKFQEYKKLNLETNS